MISGPPPVTLSIAWWGHVWAAGDLHHIPGGNVVGASTDPLRSGVRLQVLGPLRAWREGVELDVGPRQQACLLALLIARSGRPISMDELIELIWDQDPPATAVNAIHKYVGALRRLLEPLVRARGTGSYVRRRGNGYLFEGCGEELDVVAFRAAVQAARGEVAKGHDEAALDRYDGALGLWRGHAGAGVPSTVRDVVRDRMSGIDGGAADWPALWRRRGISSRACRSTRPGPA